MNEARTIPARRGSGAFVQRGQIVMVINTHGEQVVVSSACPQNFLPTNGTVGQPTGAHFRIVDTGLQQGGHVA